MAGKKVDRDYVHPLYGSSATVPSHSSLPVKVEAPSVSPFRVGLVLTHWLLCRTVILALDLLSIATVVTWLFWMVLSFGYNDDTLRTKFVEWILNWNPLDTLSNIKSSVIDGCKDWWHWVLERSKGK